jgi:hypothetical protein
MNTNKEMQKYYLDKLDKVECTTNHDYHIRKMRERFYEEFDEIWKKVKLGKATRQAWEKALNKWLKMESI